MCSIDLCGIMLGVYIFMIFIYLDELDLIPKESPSLTHFAVFDLKPALSGYEELDNHSYNQ